MTTEVTTLRKITAKGVLGAIEKPSKPTALFRVYGVINGHELKPATQEGYKPSHKFEGTFEAVNLKTGEIFEAPVCYLPSPYDSILARTVDAIVAKSEFPSVEFALEVGVTPSNKGNTGYEWTTKPIVKPGANDPLIGLRDQVKALPAPKK